MSQTSYNIEQSEAFAGLKVDSRFDTVESHLCEGAIDFGLGVVAGTDPVRQVKVPAADTDVLRGISIHRHVEKALGTGVAQYKDKETADVLRKGVVWMVVEPTVASLAVDDDAYINVAVAAHRGKVTEVSTGNIATGGKCRKLATSAGGEALAAIEINLP